MFTPKKSKSQVLQNPTDQPETTQKVTNPGHPLGIHKDPRVIAMTQPSGSNIPVLPRPVDPMDPIPGTSTQEDPETISISDTKSSQSLADFPIGTPKEGQDSEDESSNRSPTGSVVLGALEAEVSITRRMWNACESGLRRIGLCTCVVHRCLGNPRTCRICEPRRRNPRYRQLEEDDYRNVNYGDVSDERLKEIIVMKFYLGNPEVKAFYPMLITKDMTAHDAIKGVAVYTNTPDYYRFILTEYWREFEAERIVDDHEVILGLRYEHISSQQHFIFVYQRNLDKYDFIMKKSKFFINPTTARQKNARKKQREDPTLIQVRDPFFGNINDELESESKSDKGSKSEKGSKSGKESKSEKDSKSEKESKSEKKKSEVKSPEEIMTPRSDHVAIDIEPPESSPVSLSGADDSILSDEASVPLLGAGPSHESRSEGETSGKEIPEDDRVNPIYCGTVFVKQGNRDYTVEEVKAMPHQREKTKWAKKYLLLRDRHLYFVVDHESMLKFYFMEDFNFAQALLKNATQNKKDRVLECIGPMIDFEVYMGIKARRHHNAPHGGGIYLRQHVGPVIKPNRLMFCPKPITDMGPAPETPDFASRGRNLWVTALRLAKHGVKIIEDYRTFMTDQMEFELKQQALRDARVPMDFTEGTGRIVHDQAEIERIRREPKQSVRFEQYEYFPQSALNHGPHLTQKYYHGDLQRPDAERMLHAANTNGAWLLRNSHARANCLTISYLYQTRIHHKYITAASYNDPSSDKRIYVATLDHRIAFYNVHSLIDFYRLNKGETMMCMLGQSLKKESQPDSSPARALSLPSPRSISRPINLLSGVSKDSPDHSSLAKSPRSLKDFISKSIGKSKQALKPKRPSTGGSSPEATPSTSKDFGPTGFRERLRQVPVDVHSSPSEEIQLKPSSSGASSTTAGESLTLDPHGEEV